MRIALLSALVSLGLAGTSKAQGVYYYGGPRPAVNFGVVTPGGFSFGYSNYSTYRPYYPGYPGYPGRGYGGYPGGHYHYYPGNYVPHGNHYHYIPGHSHYHRR